MHLLYTWGGSVGCACLREYSVCVNVGNRMEWFLKKNIGALGMLCRIGPQIQHFSLKCCLFTWCRATFFVFNMFKGFTLNKTCCLVCLKAKNERRKKFIWPGQEQICALWGPNIKKIWIFFLASVLWSKREVFANQKILIFKVPVIFLKVKTLLRTQAA